MGDRLTSSSEMMYIGKMNDDRAKDHMEVCCACFHISLVVYYIKENLRNPSQSWHPPKTPS